MSHPFRDTLYIIYTTSKTCSFDSFYNGPIMVFAFQIYHKSINEKKGSFSRECCSQRFPNKWGQYEGYLLCEIIGYYEEIFGITLSGNLV